MNIFETLYKEFTDFFGITGIIEVLEKGDYAVFKTWSFISQLIYALIPFLLLFEIIRGLLYKRFHFNNIKMPLLVYILNRFIGQVISIGMVAICIGLFSRFAVFKTSFTWYWLIYGYIIWEFAHFIYHYLAHKVRLFWCLHSTHHAPQKMNLFVNFAHFFLEAPYADFIRTSICIVMGVNPELLFLIMFIDGVWGSFIHIGEEIAKDARLGFLHRIVLTPSHHRVHHASNPMYMDTNFCNLLNIWDKIFKTYQDEDRKIEIKYGITREMNPNNVLDAYFGEIVYLAKDVIKAPGLKNKFLYIIMPPGWSHTGDHKTAKIMRQKYFEEQIQK